MAERASRVGGTFEITSSPEDGTLVVIDVPAIAGHLPGNSDEDQAGG
jgi:nitrate/nitrite-specific signal transduction histidine kinase